uniref:Uncharacterized protein n=1 Tax=Rhodosorus marinus TaxID=101924 RepID=A0A7S2ZUX7_9RHOD|mmetsp:Transcript_33577/g.132480  ORF Transcript_33577/g.132480 Transcript_33577/m.132480 type:complete len:167 (+) Transcript_33577:424-924(+)
MSSGSLLWLKFKRRKDRFTGSHSNAGGKDFSLPKHESPSQERGQQERPCGVRLRVQDQRQLIMIKDHLERLAPPAPPPAPLQKRENWRFVTSKKAKLTEHQKIFRISASVEALSAKIHDMQNSKSPVFETPFSQSHVDLEQKLDDLIAKGFAVSLLLRPSQCAVRS